MKIKLLVIILSLTGFLTLSCGENEEQDRLYQQLSEWMTGSFSSAGQAAKDSSYYDIRLHMAPIWKEREDGYWLYVEQAVSEYKNQPYRQRVYQLKKSANNNFQSVVYTFPDPLRFAGDWNKEEPLSGLSIDSLSIRDGCTITINWDGEKYVGSTNDKDCQSELRGAKYATSEVEIYKDRLISWDRGFNDEDEQVWGAEKGGYIFRK